MRLSTSLNHCERARRQVLDAINPYTSHKQFLEKYVKIMQSLKKCPSWVRYTVAETSRTWWEAMYRYELSWCTLEWKGERYLTWNDIPEEGKEYIRKHPSTDPFLLANQYHFWKKTGVKL